MRCRKTAAKLNAYLDDEILDSSEPEITRHLSTCKRCQDLRETLNLPRLYLGKLKDVPTKDFYPDMERVFRSRQIFSAWVFVRAGGVFLIAALLVAGLYLFYIGRHETTLLDRRDILVPSGFYEVDVLPEAKESLFDTTSPTMVKIEEGSWISVKGKASVYKDKGSLKVELTQGDFYFVFADSLMGRKIIEVAGFKITAVKTEFFIHADELKTELKLLSGELLIKYFEGRTLMALYLHSGEGATGTGSAGTKRLDVYKLSPLKNADLEMKIQRIKRIGQWFETNPNQGRFESGEIRIEFWKGG